MLVKLDGIIRTMDRSDNIIIAADEELDTLEKKFVQLGKNA